MKAIVINQFGAPEQLHIEEVSMPMVKSGQALVRVHAAGVNPVDFKIRNGSMKFISGKKFPRILGGDLAGVVEQTAGKSKFRPGDRVFGMLTYTGGAYGEFVAVKESQLCPIPEGLQMTDAAAVPLAALTALQSLQKGKGIKTGSRVLVNGASGGVGSFAVQIAKALGAEVTGVCSARNIEFVKSLGADRVIDYQAEDFTKLGNTYDHLFDAVAKSSFGKCKKLLEKDGCYVSTIPNNGLFFHQFFNFLRKKKAWFIMTKASGEDLAIIADLIVTGKVKVHVEKVFPYQEVVKAHEMIETERVKGKIVLAFIS